MQPIRQATTEEENVSRRVYLRGVVLKGLSKKDLNSMLAKCSIVKFKEVMKKSTAQT
jgi:hypothetical protein